MESDGEDEVHERGGRTGGTTNIIITGDYDDDFGEEAEEQNERHPMRGNSTHIKGKYYKQTYRPAWEQMPDFKGWLRGVPGEATQAYCIYCQKTLHAHRLSLLKHACTIRHQKAAQLHSSRKNKVPTQVVEEIESVQFIEANSSASQDEDKEGNMTITTVMQYHSGTEEEDQEEHEMEEAEDEDSIQLEPVQFQRFVKPSVATNMSTSGKAPISTHVLDTAKGTPVNGLQVSLYKLVDGRWTYMNEGTTNTDGRFANFMEQNDFTPGRYKLHFDVDRYFELKKQESLYPFIEIVFDCRGLGEHYHVPLLLSPYGYTTYKGS